MNLQTSAKRVVQHFSGDTQLPSGLTVAIEKAQSQIERIFKYSLPKDVEWRSYEHPDYEKDRKDVLQKDAQGFITKDRKKIYVDLAKIGEGDYEEFALHEIGHFLDRDLGNGRYFSRTLKVPALKDEPHEAFAMMVAYVVQEGHPGGAGQTAMYKEVCKKLNIDPLGKRAQA